jgi:hypothetical protein
MKVFDLQCAQGHRFEGWFASEDDFQSQSQRALVQCPLCGDPSVVKKLSAPRLNLTTCRTDAQSGVEQQVAGTPINQQALDASWLAVARKIVANTTDVGPQFADEARRIHYGEAEIRAIRGQTTVKEARDLIEEGIVVVPLMLPDSVKEPLH